MADKSISSVTDRTISDLRESLISETEPLAVRFRALFSLKHVAIRNDSPSAVKAIADAFSSKSALLKHEVAYCLGQTKNTAAIPYLCAVLENKDEDPMCRHEAAEAMGAIGDIRCLDILKQYRDDESEATVVKETCEVAIDRITWENGVELKEDLHSSDFKSIDPAPPTDGSRSVEELERVLLNQKLPLFLRYRAMFSLRDMASPPTLTTAVPSVLALAKGFTDPSALFRHEIAFVFGQLAHPASIPALTYTLSDLDEASMVRHEAAEALGALGEEKGVIETLKSFLNDKEQVVRESVVVALDMADHEMSGEIEYALIPEIPA
ncbi:BgTH12-00317 [Blumeria graminis f. sp. triticale]|uniref:Deoxyhypusine hydroxylase n=3 Tax=Blumeria graminis TaxID=34373 RepID=A0A061HII6_BLUGR|nr:Deoxyhypusine hydroxylase [Blumeria graminis f. sp. tritici 96224]CAD6504814.1 BgTH12-00317 [Blumeria graminis f. sp. triticale]VDB92837.1 Bgt-505 [Blumeria graminis f. sp. tritici]